MPRFFTHPESQERLGDTLASQLQNRTWTSFSAAIAFLKRSGMRHFAGPLRDFSGSASSTVVVGIDHGGTTQEGLELLLESLGEHGRAFVFHNGNHSTFHPKVYCFKNDTSARCIVGSGNGTEGGLFTNYEAFIDFNLDLAAAPDRAILSDIDEAFDRWTNEASHTPPLTRRLTEQLIRDLRERALIPTEEEVARQFSVTRAIEEAQEHGNQEDETTSIPLFGAVAVPRAPQSTHASRRPRSTGTSVPLPTPVHGGVTGFVITLQQTDVGTGQTHAGTARRSPELFLPKICVRDNPDFWGWPTEFSPDPAWHGPVDNEGYGKMDRSGVRMLLGGQIHPVNWWYNPNKRDYRMRSEVLRSAGNVGDILRIERADGSRGFDYYVEVVPQGTSDYVRYSAICTRPVRNSLKRYGFY